jgi:predicted PurR-regulated permease PerM
MYVSPIKNIRDVLIVLFLIILFLYYAQEFLIPITISALFSFLFLPLAIRLEKWLGRIPSIIICLLIIILILAGFIFFFYSETITFVDDFPNLKAKASEKFHRVIDFIESKTNISSNQQINWINNVFKNHFKETGKWFEGALLGITTLFLSLALVAVYIFCFLYYREKFYQFFISLFKGEKRNEVDKVMLNIRTLSGRYFSGILIVMIILGTMHSIGLLLLGIEHAIFLGYLAGFFIVVPFVGTMIGSMLPIIIALVTKDSIWYAVGVAGIFSFNLFIESHILTPLIVGSHIQINPMAIIVAIIVGGLIWGLAGMVLFIPLIGILKILADNIEPLKPLSILLGDTNRGTSKVFQILKRDKTL